MKIFPSQTFFLCKQFFFPVAPSRIKFLSCLQTIYLGVLLLQKKKNQEGYFVSVKNAVFQKFYQEMFSNIFVSKLTCSLVVFILQANLERQKDGCKCTPCSKETNMATKAEEEKETK